MSRGETLGHLLLFSSGKAYLALDPVTYPSLFPFQAAAARLDSTFRFCLREFIGDRLFPTG
ncbi:hypothetical protein [Myxosarcina sp. GI1(2024)]